MDDQVFKLLIDKIDGVKADVDEVKKDVRELLFFKWKVVGMALLAGIIFEVVVRLMGST